MSLRTFHLLFILIAIMGADLFGGWALHRYGVVGDGEILALGVVSFVGGLGLAGYLLWLMHRADRGLLG